VKQHAAVGVRHEDIALVLGISADTLTKYYPKELALGRIELDALVAGKLAKAATSPLMTGPSVTAAIYWTKARMGWREAQETNFDHAMTIKVVGGLPE